MPRLLALILISALSHSVAADDCTVSTDPPDLSRSSLPVSNQHSDPSQGLHSAILESGDLILIRYGRCELSKSSWYFSKTSEINSANFKAWAQMVIVTEGDVEALGQQMKNAGSPLQPGNELTVQSGADHHSFTITLPGTPLFSAAAFYNWTPPPH